MDTTKKSDEVTLAEAFGAVAKPEDVAENEGSDAMELTFGKGVAKRTILVTQGITVNEFVESSR